MLIIQRRDPKKSMQRFYALAVHPDLISGWSLQREWGRIGSPGRVVIEPFSDECEAAAAGADIEMAKRRRGYRNQVNRIAPRSKAQETSRSRPVVDPASAIW